MSWFANQPFVGLTAAVTRALGQRDGSVLAHLRFKSNIFENVRADCNLLAHEIGLTPEQVRRAMAELRKLGLIEDGDRKAAGIVSPFDRRTVIRVNIEAAEAFVEDSERKYLAERKASNCGSDESATPTRQDGRLGEAPEPLGDGTEADSSTHTKKSKEDTKNADASHGEESKTPGGPVTRKTRERDVVFDALAIHAEGIDPEIVMGVGVNKTLATKIAKVAHDLRACRVTTGDHVKALVDAWPHVFPGATLTATGIGAQFGPLARYISDLKKGKARPVGKPTAASQTHAHIAAARAKLTGANVPSQAQLGRPDVIEAESVVR